MTLEELKIIGERVQTTLGGVVVYAKGHTVIGRKKITQEEFERHLFGKLDDLTSPAKKIAEVDGKDTWEAPEISPRIKAINEAAREAMMAALPGRAETRRERA